ncbi:MAG: hypothetical protein DCF20_17710 [Pseudanabaena sp.]|nr:MAG: hypothetical protein DCF20_17710 [Pseudanabaena sp.]
MNLQPKSWILLAAIILVCMGLGLYFYTTTQTNRRKLEMNKCRNELMEMKKNSQYSQKEIELVCKQRVYGG